MSRSHTPEARYDAAVEREKRLRKLRDELERVLLRAMVKGSPVVDRHGCPVVDEKGELRFGPTSPLMIREVIAYLRAIGYLDRVENPQEAVREMVTRAQLIAAEEKVRAVVERRGNPASPVSDLDDADTELEGVYETCHA